MKIPHLATLALLLATALLGCRVTDLPLWDAPEAKRPDANPVREELGIAYCDDGEPHHQLDVYVPEGRESFPVVVLVHGGAWMVGDNRCCGLYPSVARFFASRGIGAVLPNYRLSPGVRHPEHVRDVALATRWTKDHIAEFGGDPKKLFLMGHSAGGHLVALLAADPTYRSAVGIWPDEIRGVIGVSGVYEIPPGDVSVRLGGDGPLSVRLDEMMPIRGNTKPRFIDLSRGSGVPIRVNIFGPAFGNNPDERAAASPINHVPPSIAANFKATHPGTPLDDTKTAPDEILRCAPPVLPPFLVFTAQHDLPLLNDIADRFVDKLAKQDWKVEHIRVPRRNHNSIIFDAITDDDPVAAKTVAFIRRHAS